MPEQGAVGQEEGEARSREAGSTDATRRRLLRGSLGAAPVLLTLVSRPVLGGQWRVLGDANGQCVTPSGFVSMPTSQHGAPTYCSGQTPDYWTLPENYSAWVAPFYPTSVSGPGGHDATLFADWFNPPHYPATTTFLQVLQLMGGPPDDVARYLVAAALNVAAGWTPVLTIPVLQGIWSEYMNTGGGTIGYYEPTAGVKWYHSDIVNYLLSTMPL